jgi:hypothetical protein
MSFWSVVKNIFIKVKNVIDLLWQKAHPFLDEVLREEIKVIWPSLQSLAITAVKQIVTKGLKGDDAKEEFKNIMMAAAKDQVSQLRTRELELLENMALAIVDKAN